MHIVGKVFLVLTGLVSIGLMLLTAPVAQDRIRLTKDVHNTRNRIPVLEAENHQLQQDRLERQREIVLEKDKITFTINHRKDRIDELESEISAIMDRVKDMQQKNAVLQAGLKKVESEIAARKAETAELTAEIAQNSQLQKQLTVEIADLEKRLDETRRNVVAGRKAIRDGYSKVAALEEQILKEMAEKKLADRSE
jgi:chromosome segregation ATPase